MNKRLSRGVTRLRPVLGAAVLGGVLALIPFSTCLARVAFGLPCPACGFTRACLALAHLDLPGAARLHPLALPLAAGVGALVPVAFLTSERAWERVTTTAIAIFTAAIIVVWILRFAGWFGGPVGP